jgi:hypothetical protein
MASEPRNSFPFPDILSFMADRTGMANGTLTPVVYFVRRTDMFAILAPAEVGGGMELARMVYDRRYKRDWLWCEATTLQEVDKLQKRLANQEIFEAEKKIAVNSAVRERVYKATGDQLRQRMCSSSTSAWERDFIKAYLQLREDKRDKYRQSLEHRNMFILAREMDSGKSIEEMCPLLPGQFERGPDGRTPIEALQAIDARNAELAHQGLM